MRNLSSLLRAENVEYILYVGDIKSIKFEVTFKDGTADSKTVSVGDGVGDIAIIGFNEKVLRVGGKFFAVRPPRAESDSE